MQLWDRDTQSLRNELPARPLDDCWAKKPIDGSNGMSVLEHSRIVGMVAQAIWASLPRSAKDVLPADFASIAAVHDVGKVSPGFQDRKMRNLPSQFCDDHTVIGDAAVQRLLGHRARAARARIVNMHHGSEHGAPPRTDEVDLYGGPEWARQRRSLLDTLAAEFGPLADTSLTAATLGAVAGLVCTADWIGSNEEHFAPAGLPAGADLSALVKAALIACGWSAPKMHLGLSFSDVFGFDTRPVQRAFIESVTAPGLYVLEAPMGMGKTEAALFSAYRLMAAGHHHGFYFGLPTRLTSDKIHERVECYLTRVCANMHDVRLAHGSAWLRCFEQGGENLGAGRPWFLPRKRALLHPFAVGTVDQALLGVVRVDHYFIRLFGLAGKVVILDEVHAYDVYTGTLLDKLIDQLLELGSTVIVLSATLTAGRRSQLIRRPVADLEQGYPLVTSAVGDALVSRTTAPAQNQDYRVCMLAADDFAVARKAVAWADSGGCVLCVANTVERAQHWYDAVKCTMREEAFPVGLLHAKFPAFQRDRLEVDWLAKLDKSGQSRPRGCVLVATQILEQSVDVDADALITELAPTDMLLQRMGRVWRHSRPLRPLAVPEVHIVCGDAGSATTRAALLDALGNKSAKVYSPYVLWRTWRVWHALERVRIPGDIRTLLDATYTDQTEAEPPLVTQLKAELEAHRQKLNGLATAADPNIYLPVGEDDEYACTRYSDQPTQDVLLVRCVDSTGRAAELGLFDGEGPVSVHADRKDFSVTVRLHRQLVSVPLWIFDALGGISRAPWLVYHFHRPTPVWHLAADGHSLLMGDRATGYTYDSERGLMRLPAGRQAPEPFVDFADEDGGDL